MDCFMECQPPEGGGSEKFYVQALPEFTIYGHTVDAWSQEKYPEDWQYTLRSREAGNEFACWHSVACPDGELGYNPVSLLGTITYEQFMEAEAAGWPNDYALTPATRDMPAVAIFTIGPDGLTEEWNSLEGDKA